MRNPATYLTPRQWLGGLFALAAFGVTILLAVKSTQEGATAAGLSISLALIAGGLQVGAAAVSRGAGRADPTLAQASVRNLRIIAFRSSEAKQLAENAQETQTGNALKSTVGVLNVHLSYIEELAVNEIEAWRSFHDRAVGDLDATPVPSDGTGQ